MTEPPYRIRPAAVRDAAGIARVQVETWKSAYRGIVPDDYLGKLCTDQKETSWRMILSGEAQENHPTPGCTADREPLPVSRAHAATADSFHFVAEQDGRIVGFAVGGPERSSDPEFPGELHAIYVLQEHQGRGLGRRLAGSVAYTLLDRGYRSMMVWVLRDNPWKRFYFSIGGTPVRFRTIDIGGIKLDEESYGWKDLHPLTRL